MEKSKARALKAIRELKALCDGNERLKAVVQKQLTPYLPEKVENRKKAREAASLIVELSQYSGDSDIMAILKDEFFGESEENEGDEAEGFQEINESSGEDLNAIVEALGEE